VNRGIAQKRVMTVAPLFTMLTTEISQEVLDSKLCREEKGKRSHYLGQPTPFEENWSAFTGDLPFWRKVVYFPGRPAHTLTLTLVYFHGRPAYTYSKWSISRATTLHTHTYPGLFSWATCSSTQSGLFSKATSPHTYTYLGLFSWMTCLSTQSGLFSAATSPHTHAYPGLFSWATYPNILKVVYFQGRPAHTLTLTLVYFHGRPAQVEKGRVVLL